MRMLSMLMCALLGGVVALNFTEEPASAQELGMLPGEVSENVWKAFNDSLSADEEYKRVASFKRAEIEPILGQWQESLNAVFVADWRDFRDSAIEIESAAEGDDVRWSLEKKSYTMRYGQFELYILKQFGGGKFSQTWTIPRDKLDAVDFEYLFAIRQGSPFDAQLTELVRDANAATIIAELCGEAGAEYSLPVGEQDEARVKVRFRERTIGDCIRKIAASAGWDVTISDGLTSRVGAVALTDVEEWLEIRKELAGATTETWRGALKSMLELKLVEVDTDRLSVHARPLNE